MLQMTFQRLVMLKMFMAAGGVSAFVFALWRANVFEAKRKSSFHVASDDFTQGLKDKSITTVAVGAAILGAGMAIAGACPGMVRLYSLSLSLSLSIRAKYITSRECQIRFYILAFGAPVYNNTGPPPYFIFAPEMKP